MRTRAASSTRTAEAKAKRRELIAWLESNWRATYTIFGRANPIGETQPITRGLLCCSGTDVASLNLAFVDDDVRDPDVAIEQAGSFFGERNVPFAVVVPQGADALAEACQERGMTCTETMPGMAMSPIRPVGIDGRIRIHAVTGSNGLAGDFLEACCTGFELDRSVAREMFVPAMFDQPDTHWFVGYVDGQLAGCGATICTVGVAGVYNVATMPELRGRGFGEALTWHAIELGRDAGCHTAVLQSTVSGYPLYTQMGFETIRTYGLYMHDGPS